MKHKLSLLSSAVLLAAASQSYAQGLNAIGHNLDWDFERRLPFSWYVGAQVGWDSNPMLLPNNEQDSGYVSATIGASYNTGDRRTAYQFHASYSPMYYWDAPPGMDDLYHNARVGFDWRHRVNPRLTITDSFYIAYEIEPDYGIGAAPARRTDQYLYGYNSLAAAYSWSRRFSTVTSWTITGIAYDSDFLDGEDYLTNIFANEFRYALSRTTTLAFTYRYAMGRYDNGFGDYDSHYILGGVDHRFSPRLTGSFRAGVEIRDREISDDEETDPYFEGALVYRVSRRTDVRWYTQIGFSDSNIGTYTDRYGYRTGISASHRINSRLIGNIDAHYIHDEYDQGLGLAPSYDEDIFAISLGFEYALCKNLSLNGGYSFTASNSDLEFNEYDRHHVQIGLGARF